MMRVPTEATGAADTPSVLVVDSLDVRIDAEQGSGYAVRGVSFAVAAGRTLAIVGESGSGKSTLALALMGLLPPTARVTNGTAYFRGENLLALSHEDLRALRGDRIAMVFQEPMTALNPTLSIDRQLTEVLEAHRGMSRPDARAVALDRLRRVRLADPEWVLAHYPHELSGGMRQRVMIAMALMADPEVLIADEPTTALDATIQAQVLDLLQEIQRELGLALILITHDMGIVAGVADDVLVMYAGRVVERAPTQALFVDARHPYPVRLIASVPMLGRRDVPLRGIPGRQPRLHEQPTGCPYFERCTALWKDNVRCTAAFPPIRLVAPDHNYACIREVSQ